MTDGDRSRTDVRAIDPAFDHGVGILFRMKTTAFTFGLVAFALAGAASIALVPACGASGDGGGDLQTDTGIVDGEIIDGGPKFAIDVEPPSASLTIPLGGTTTQSYQAFAIAPDGTKSEVTTTCTWSLDDPSYGSFAGAKLGAAQHGGTTKVIATCKQGIGSSDLTIKLTGAINAPDAPTNAAALFTAAVSSADPTKTPTVEYPLQGAVAPLNIPSIDAQWTTAGNDLFHLSFASKYVAVDYYTKSADGAFTEADWKNVAKSAAGQTLSVVVEGLVVASPAQKYASASTQVHLSTDTIDNTALYYWASSTGNLMTTTFGDTGAPTSVHGDCTSCHSVSRAGTRIGYARCVGGDCGQLFAGFMKYDDASKTWKDTVDANGKAIEGSFTTFAPKGYPFATDAKSVALVTMKSGELELYDPDTGALVPSTVKDVSSSSGTLAALMPDWSPDGHSVVFVQTPHPGQWIDLDGGSIVTMQYTFDGTNHSFAAPKPIVTGPITLPSGSYENLFFPSFSADGKLIVFNAARAQWRNLSDATAPGQRLMLTDPAGSFKVELAAMNGDGDHNVTWPHWAPGAAKDYYWVVFSSERDYGHKITAGNTAAACVANGVKQCKQIWIGAIDRTKIGSGADPSAPPMWMPGQDPGADNISPYWTVPASTAH
jgi:hypothetical protein